MLLVGPRVAISSVSEFASGAIPSLSACVRTPRTSRSKSNATARCSGTERARRYSTCKVANPGQGRSTLLPRSSPCWRARNVPDSTWSRRRFFGLPATTTTACSSRSIQHEQETEVPDVLHNDNATLACSTTSTNDPARAHVLHEHGSRPCLLDEANDPVIASEHKPRNVLEQHRSRRDRSHRAQQRVRSVRQRSMWIRTRRTDRERPRPGGCCSTGARR